MGEAIFDKMVKECFIEKMMLEQRPRGGERTSYTDILRKNFLAEIRASGGSADHL